MITQIALINIVMFLSYVNYIYSVAEKEVRVFKVLRTLKSKIYISIITLNSILFSGIINLNVYAFLIIFTLIVMSIIDIKKHVVSDNINAFLFITGILYVMQSLNPQIFVENLVGAFALIGLFTYIRFSSTIFFEKEIIGEGDFIPLSMFVLLFGFEVGLFWLLVSFALTLPVLIYKRIRKMSEELAFLPFISFSIALAMLENSEISEPVIAIIKSIILE